MISPTIFRSNRIPGLLCVASTLILQLAAAPASVFAQDEHKHSNVPNMDIRVNPPVPQAAVSGLSAAAVGKAKQSLGASVAKAVGQFTAGLPGAEVKLSPETGAVEMVSAATALTDAAPGRASFDIVKDFLTANAALYGLAEADLANLHFLGESVSPGSGLRMVRVEQRVNGQPVFQSETRFILDRDGRLIRSVGQMVPNATATAAALDHRVTAPQALVAAMASVGEQLDAGTMTQVNTSADGRKTEVVTNDAHVSTHVVSQLVYFPLAPGVLVPAWSQVAMTEGDGDWYTLVDANSGQLLWRKNIRAHLSNEEARFQVFVQADGKTPADSPAPQSPTTATPGANLQPAGIARSIVSMSAVQNLTASPNGWITDGLTTTSGNNATAYLDVSQGANANLPDVLATSVLDGGAQPTGNPDAFGRNRDFLGTTPRNFTLLAPPQSGDPESGQTATGSGSSGTLPIDAFRRGVVTHLFYLTNWYHDQLYSLGFDEAAGNFQNLNFSGFGAGNDRVLAEADDGSGTNNANFATPPDGQSGRMQMYIFNGPTVDRDGSLDAEIVLHELTHGLSNRLIGNGSGLIWDVGGGMGEGWSDFYALSLLNNTNADDPNGKYASGAYATYKLAGLTDNYLYGIRRFPYSTDNSVNPMTWADVDDVTNNLSGGIATSPLNFNGGGGCEVHNSGEIWCLTLWEVRSRVIADPAGANGDVPTGNQKMLQLITDSLKMTPVNPSFIEGRDAIIAADMATNAGANEKWIWQGFADRGLGYNAVAPYSRLFGYLAGHVSIGESFDVPYLDVQGTTIDDSIGNNNGAIDPNEPVKLSVTLKNPWRSASMAVTGAAATLTCATPGVVISDGASTYGAIAPLGTATGDTFRFTVPPGATAGQALDFTITVTSSLLGTKAVNFKMRVGTPAGNGAPVVYTMASSLAIPDNLGRGTFQSQVITDDFEIADLDFRVDNLTHTFSGDVSVLLRGPTGIGTDLISVIGGGVSGGGGGDNLVNTVVDDSATGDFLLAANTAAPFTGSWKPIFNTPTWTTFGFPAVDPVGSLSRYNGLTTKGSWTVLVSDQASTDTGTLNSWSIIVTPKAYTVSPYVPAPEIAIEDPLANDVPNGSTRDYLSVNAGSSVSVPFTIKNTGDSDLTGLTYLIDGPDAGQFAVTLDPVAPVTAGNSTTITIKFQPTSLGVKNAAIHIANNDSNENPFNINLAGTGTCPTITVSSPGVTAGTVGAAFSQTFTQTGAFGSVTFSKTGALPAGVALASNGVLSGMPLEAGTFPITVTATDSLACTGSSSVYTLVIAPAQAVPSNRLTEATDASNNTPLTATPVAPVGGLVKISGNLVPNGDVDYYAFTATAGDRVYAAVMTSASAGSSTDSQLTLLASDGTTIIEFDDDNGSFAGLSSSIAGAIIPSTGTYYLKVNDFTAGTTTMRGYDLYLQLRNGSPTVETEPNDTNGAPNPGVNNYWVSGARSPAASTEQDWYPITLNAGDTVFLSLDMDPEDDVVVWNGRLGLALFGDAGNQILVVDDAGTGDVTPLPNRPSEAMFLTVKNSGTYYAFVDSASAATGGPTATYNLNISVLPAIAETWTTYASSDVPKTVGPGTGLVSSTITIPGNPRIAKIRVNLNLNHALMADQDVHLRSPAGNDIGLFTDIGAAATGGQTQMDLTFSDDAAIPPTFTVLKSMILKPELSYRLKWFNGEDAGGTWTLDIRDDTAGGNGGTLNSWSIDIVEEPAPAPGMQIYATDFEFGPAGFTHSGTADEWELGTPATVATTTANPIASFVTANSGVNCWKTDLDNTYDVSSDQNLDSPNIDLTGYTGEIRLDWAQKYQLESATFDHAYVEVQEVGGSGRTRRVWEWLDGNMTDAPGNPATNIGASAGWANMHADISDFAGKTIRIRFHLDSSASVNLGGLAIDDVAVINVFPTGPAPVVPLASTLGDVVSDEGAPNTLGSASIGKYDVLRRGGAISINSHLVFPGYLLVDAGPPIVTVDDFQGIWKDDAITGLKLLARSGGAAPGTTGAVFDILPEVPAMAHYGVSTLYATLRLGVGDTTSGNDTGIWTEGTTEGTLGLLLREGDPVPGVAGAFVDRFATGVFGTAMPAEFIYRAGIPLVMKGATTDSAVLVAERLSANPINWAVVAREGALAPGSAESFGFLASAYTDPVRMDPQGNLTMNAILKPSQNEGIWYLARGVGAVLQKVVVTGDVAPGTSGATFSRIEKAFVGDSGTLGFHAYLNMDGDNTTNTRSDGIWVGKLAGGFQCVLRSGDTAVASLPPGAKVGSLWSGWLSLGNRLALRGWVDMDGDGDSESPTDVHGIYTDSSGTMTLLAKVGDAAPGVAGATFAAVDLPVIGGNSQTAFLGRIAGPGVTSANDEGLWRQEPNGGALFLVLRSGDSITTTQGAKIVQKIDFPGTSQPAFTTDHRWEQPVMDQTGAMILNVTFTDGSSSQVRAP